MIPASSLHAAKDSTNSAPVAKNSTSSAFASIRARPVRVLRQY